MLDSLLQESDLRSCQVAFPPELEAETRMELDPLDAEDDAAGPRTASIPFDEPNDDDMKPMGTRLDDKAEQESELLDSLVMCGFPKDEAARLEAWMALPRETRAAIRRLHHISGHKPVTVMLHLLRGARASPELIKAVKNFRCPDCTETDQTANTCKFKMPSTYAFNYNVILDVFYLKDSDGTTFGFLSIVCAGTTFHAASLVCIGNGNPPSSKCLSKFQSHWTTWAGWPAFVSTDRGLHNRGVFARAMVHNGTSQINSGLESPEHLGRGERQGGLLKKVSKVLIKHFNAVGKKQMKSMMYVSVET